ncbi:RNA-binding protein 20 [Triplophysa tibetana]|uniref:RNA-binding protein 20 n=1 Tax=Triplophysa tibetana TaxID=1572043 RepID=A0A5A9NTX0_9TELE|nr:RNA-binding protein 20 [Triplophysa tibetana]
MKQTWDKGVFENGRSKFPGNGARTTSEHLQSSTGDKPDKSLPPLGGALGGVGQNLLLSPASLQLAQLQAQLTLHRLKLAQSTNTAAAASVLNQVLSNVAMSQPLFNQLRGSGMPQAHGGAFPPPPISFPPPNSALGTLVGSGFNPNPTGIRPTTYGGGSNQNVSQHNEYGKKTGTYLTDTDRRLQFGFLGGASVVTSKACDAGQYGGPQPRNNVQSNFQRDFYTSESQVKPTGYLGGVSDQNLGPLSSSAPQEQWKGPVNMGKMDMGTGAGSGAWVPTGPGFMGQRAELYNPEEPTADPKFNSACGPGVGPSMGQQGGFQQQPQLHQGEEGVRMSLQPHQLNDFHGTTPSHLPHQCTICEKKVYNLKDWDQHVKGKLHLQNCSLYTESPMVGGVHFPVSSEGCLNMALSNTMAYSSAPGQDVSTGSASYLPATAIKSFPLTGVGFNSHQSEAKFLQRKPCPGRVVHICNLPEGSCTENDVINLGIPFGKVTNYILMRSTHQAFLEMAYVEAAQAMVQYYQLQPATINEQKLLIRMSKRYKELQLKKPGKDVLSIIQDINSQRGRDEMQEIDRYLPERARSRSPVSRSQSPRSHSPSFTSCSSAHSPPGPPGRPDWSNGMGPRRSSWDWSSHLRGNDDPRDRDIWGNGEEDRPNGWLSERRKPYLKSGDRNSPRMGPGDERGRDWYPRGSPQGSSFSSSYHSIDDFYKKDSLYKSDKQSRSQHHRHEGKSKRREGGDHRPRHSESDVIDDTSSNRMAEDRGRSKRSSRRQEKEERESENQKEENPAKERSSSPHNIKPSEPKMCERNGAIEGLDSGDDGEEESWYPKSMEELVTVDEVGGEEDSIVEPDLPELQEEDQNVEAGTQAVVSPNPSEKNTPKQSEESSLVPLTLPALDIDLEESSSGPLPSPKEMSPATSLQEQPISQLIQFPSQEFKTALEQSCTSTVMEPDINPTTPAGRPNHDIPCENGKLTDTQLSNDERKVIEMDDKNPCLKPDGEKKDIPDTSPAPSSQMIDVSAISPSHEQEKAISEHSIPLGVEFIVPRTGFYCNLCGLFYTNEQIAKTSHCRSTIHYRNLQKYLSQLSEESVLNFHTGSANTE